MGSYGPVWMQCIWCSAKGKVSLDHGELPHQVPMLLDVDGVGVICEACWKLGEDVSMDEHSAELPNSVWMNIKASLGS